MCLPKENSMKVSKLKLELRISLGIFFQVFLLLALSQGVLESAVLRIDSSAQERVLAKILDEGTVKKNEVYFYYSKELTTKRAMVMQLDQAKGLVGLTSSGFDVKAGDLFVDKDWFVVLALLDRGGDIESVRKIVSDLPGETAFSDLATNSLEGFKVSIEKALVLRLKQVEGQNNAPDASSLFLLKLTLGDFHFRYNSDYALAYRFYLEGLKAYPKLGTLQLKALIKAGDCQLNLKNFSEALEWYQKALKRYQVNSLDYAEEISQLEKKINIITKNLNNSKPQEVEAKQTTLSGAREKVIGYARNLLDQVWSPNEVDQGKNFLFDCQGTVAKIFWKVGVDLTKNYNEPGYQNLLGGVPRIYKTYQTEGKTYLAKRPKAGDLVFFDNTWDYNGNGKWDDTLTHVGLVETVEADGTVGVIHHCSKGIKRYYFNLEKPTVYQDETGKVLNSFIRRQSASDLPGTSYVLGSYVSGFAQVLN